MSTSSTMTLSDGLSSSSSSLNADSMISADSVQLGGRGYHHKRGCKCPLCKKGGKRKYKKGGENTPSPEMMEEETFKDLEIGPSMNESKEETFKDLEIGMPEYNPEAEEMAGGKTRKYKRGSSRKSRKVSKRKTRKGGKKRSLKRKSRKY